MTDLPSEATAVPARLGVTARFDDRGLTLELVPTPPVLHHGVVRASVVSFLVDAVAGIVLDSDPESWTLTTDMTIRMRAIPAPTMLSANPTILRRGGRSATGEVDVLDGEGEVVAFGAIGFAHVPRKPGDPPKPSVPPEVTPELFRERAGLDRPLRDAAGIERIDPAAGVVQIAVVPDVCNPAGTLQGAMVALVAEAAAEDLLAEHLGAPVVITDLDVRYLGRIASGVVRTRCRRLGEGAGAVVAIELRDTSDDRLTTLVHARALPVGSVLESP